MQQIWLEKGRVEAMRKTLKMVLAVRFEVTLEKFDDQLAKLSWQALEKLNEIALKVDTLTEFSDQLAEMLPPDSATGSAAES